MSYDEVDIADMDWNEELQAFTYQCPCGDLFQITRVRHLLPTDEACRSSADVTGLLMVQEELAAGEEIARCPSCSLVLTVVYDPVSFLLPVRAAGQENTTAFGKVSCTQADFQEPLPAEPATVAVA